MRYKDLTEEQKEKIIKVYHLDLSEAERSKQLADEFGCAPRTVRDWWKRLGVSGAGKEEQSEEFQEAKKREVDSSKKVYLITWAQNSTPIHRKGWEGMKAYAKERNAEIIVIAGVYGTPTSLAASKSQKLTWDSELLPYLSAKRHNIHKYLNVFSDVRIRPTAHNPLSGIEGFSGLESSVIGHPKQFMKVIPTLPDQQDKVLFSTGSITHKNYTESKAGAKGEFDHVLGFLVVEIDNENRFFIRNVSINDNTGEFNDLIYNVKDGKITKNTSCAGIKFGDIHSGSTDWEAVNETFYLLNQLTPKYIFLEDVFDAYSISHHHRKNPFLKYHKRRRNLDVLSLEIEQMYKTLGMFVGNFPNSQIVIPSANHNEHLDRYLMEEDWRKDIVNAETATKLQSIMLNNDMTGGIIPYLINQKLPEIKCLNRGDSLMIKDVEMALHGDKGANGSRGSMTQFRRLPTKCVVAHGHSPFIYGGAYAVGHMMHKDLSDIDKDAYNKGLSSNMQCNVIIDNLGKRQTLLYFNGKFTNLI